MIFKSKKGIWGLGAANYDQFEHDLANVMDLFRGEKKLERGVYDEFNYKVKGVQTQISMGVIDDYLVSTFSGKTSFHVKCDLEKKEIFFHIECTDTEATFKGQFGIKELEKYGVDDKQRLHISFVTVVGVHSYSVNFTIWRA